MKLTYSEHDIQNTIISYLWMKGYYVMRMNSGRVPVVNKYGQTHMVQMGEAGTPDILAFKPGLYNEVSLLFVEVKAGKNKATLLQENKMKDLTRYGARCLIAYSIEDLQKEGI